MKNRLNYLTLPSGVGYADWDDAWRSHPDAVIGMASDWDEGSGITLWSRRDAQGVEAPRALRIAWRTLVGGVR